MKGAKNITKIAAKQVLFDDVSQLKNTTRWTKFHLMNFFFTCESLLIIEFPANRPKHFGFAWQLPSDNYKINRTLKKKNVYHL